MKRTKLLIVLLLLSLQISAQKIAGTVKTAGGETLAGASVKVEDTYIGTLTDEKGKFRLENLSAGSYRISFRYIGYETVQKTIELSEGEHLEMEISLPESELMTDEVTVEAYRADITTPVAFTDIEKAELERQNYGKDVPYILKMTPSVVVNSDAGTGIGYTTMRIRGTDVSRINVSLDGVPLNDAESHGVWWVNMPDYTSSANSIQVQRGVGSSVNGAAAFGANINISTNKLNKEAYAELNGTYGTYNTQKLTAKAGTGLLNKHFAADFRLSKIHSDGYIDRARTDLQSFFASAAYTDKKNLFRLNVTRGHEETYQAWYGVPKSKLENDRSYNPYSYENEIDHYTQTHVQAFYTRALLQSLNFNTALHYTKGAGYYEQYMDKNNPYAATSLEYYGLEPIEIGDSVITNTNLIRRKWLDNDFYGFIYSFDFQKNSFKAILGGGYNEYNGRHFGRIIWSEFASNGDIRHEWYNNTGFKTDLNTYLKINYQIGNLNFWADMQYRQLHYLIDGTEDDGNALDLDLDYPFFNPKAGLSYQLPGGQAYASYAKAMREPARSDLVEADPDNLPQAESLHDYEAGYKYNAESFAFNVNFYYMDYKNQLVLTGEINDVGGVVASNVPESYRAGIELAGGVKLWERVNWNLNFTYSRNKIKNYTNYIDNWDTGGQKPENFEETNISFSPDIISASMLEVKLVKGLYLNFDSKYVSRQYIDNTANIERSLDPYFVNNLQLRYRFQIPGTEEVSVSLRANNIFNEKYETNAWVYRYIYGGEEYADFGYFPQAPLHYSGSLSIRF